MIGAIIGDVIGSRFERGEIMAKRSGLSGQQKTTEFELFTPACKFTDDTVATCAIAYSILNADWLKENVLYPNVYGQGLKEICPLYPACGWGEMFAQWVFSEDTSPYNSWGNGSAMRVSPIAYAFENEDLDFVLEQAKQSAEVTHNHPEGIKGAQALTHCIYMALKGASKEDIRNAVKKHYYPLNRCLDDIRPTYTFKVSCQGSVPIAILAFLESEDFESAIRLAVSMGGDTDTIAAMTGSIAQPFYKKISRSIVTNTLDRLDQKLIRILKDFTDKFPSSGVAFMS